MASSELTLEDRKAVDAIVATLVYHVRKDHPRPTDRDPARRDAHPKHHGCVKANPHDREEPARPPRTGAVFAARAIRMLDPFLERVQSATRSRPRCARHGDQSSGARRYRERRRHPGLPARHAQGLFREGPCRFPRLPRRSRGRGRPWASTAEPSVFSSACVHSGSSGADSWRSRGHSTCARTLSSAPTSARSRTGYGSRQAKFRARPRQHGNPLQWLRLWLRVVFHTITSSWNRAFVGSSPRFIGKVNDWWKDSLHEALLARLRRGSASFDIEVQIRGEGDPDLDDALTPWRASRYVKVATLAIPRLAHDFHVQTMMKFGEHLSYTPWHHVPAHEPLGSINLARRAVYDAISTVRHHLNHKLRREPRRGETQDDYLRAIDAPAPNGRETRPRPT